MSEEDVATDINQQEAQAIEKPVAEKMVPQSEVENIIHARLMREREKMSTNNMGGIESQPAFDREALLQEAAEMMQKQMDEQRNEQDRASRTAQVEEIARKYLDKMGQGKELYDDFEEITQDYSPGTYPQITAMATEFDNLPDIVYELSKNPRKLVDLHVLASTDKRLAYKEMAKLSQSIKNNEEALINNVKSPAPLSKLKSSVVAGQDNGKKTIRDLRKESRYRG